MLPRFCRCAFLITGGLMVLLALALALRIDLDTAPTPTHQIEHARVAQAVSQLEGGCLTCHDRVNNTPQIDYQLTALAFETTPISLSLPDQLHAQLTQTGQRILNLPQVRDQRFETVVEEYLHVYAQVSAGDTVSEPVAQWALGQLDSIASVLRILEHQAARVQLARSDNQPTPSGAAVLHTLTSPPMVAAVVQSVSVGDMVRFRVARLLITQFAMPQELVYATQRRGPPAGVVLDSVG